MNEKNEKKYSLRKRAESFAFAISGLGVLLRSQKNFQLHVITAVAIILLGLWLEIHGAKWALLVLCMAMVLVTEAINTSIEMVIDMNSTQRSWPAKFAKDVAAAAVLMVCVASVIVGLLILGPPLYRKLIGIL